MDGRHNRRMNGLMDGHKVEYILREMVWAVYTKRLAAKWDDQPLVSTEGKGKQDGLK